MEFENLAAPLADGAEPTITNYEGLAFGPRRTDGRASLFVLSDDNFRQFHENAWLLHFAADSAIPRISDVQGAAQRSPRESRWVVGLEGVVTAVESGKPPRWFVESAEPGSDPATSEAIQVIAGPPARDTLAPAVQVGDRLRLTGRVGAGTGGQLHAAPGDHRGGSRRRALVRRRARSSSGGGALRGAAPIPPRLSARPDAAFDPEVDPLDYWESFESMRVFLAAADVAGPTNSFRETVLSSTGPAPRRVLQRGPRASTRPSRGSRRSWSAVACSATSPNSLPPAPASDASRACSTTASRTTAFSPPVLSWFKHPAGRVRKRRPFVRHPMPSRSRPSISRI